VEFSGSVRGFDPALQQELKDGIEKIVSDVAKKYGLTAEAVFNGVYPALVNSKNETDFALAVARHTVGDASVMGQVPRTLGTEDFAWFLQKKPGNFMALGTGAPDDATPPDLHSPRYDFNDAALPYGASYWVHLVEKALPLNRVIAPGEQRPPLPPAPGI